MKTRNNKRKPIVTKIISKPFDKKIEKAFIRYTYDITKFVATKENILLEILFDYRGTLVIPKSLKDSISPGNYSVSGSYSIPKDLKDPVLLKDCNLLTRSEVILFIKKNIRKGYMDHIKQLIHDELFPDVKIIDKLPW